MSSTPATPADRPTRPVPSAVDTDSVTAGLRTVATFEAVKGAFVLVAGLGLLSLLHRDAGDAAERLLTTLHINPEHRYSRVFLDAADKLTDSKLWAIAAGSAVYSTVRFVEAYGLWNRMVWAEWFALLSGSLYLPWELYALLNKPTWLHWLVFLVNLFIVLYMLGIRLREVRRYRAVRVPG